MVRRRKLLLPAALCLCLALLLGGCAFRAGAPAAESKPLRIVVASDLHYLSSALTDEGPLFRRVVESGDGKLMLDIEEITEAFVWQMLEERPDAVVLSGDLSFNGEYRSNADLAEKLERLHAAGIPVFVIPGNHDIARSGTVRFIGETWEEVRNTSADEFRALYADLAADRVISRDESSDSYVCALGSGLRLILLDTNSRAYNALPEQSFSWLEKELRAARRAGDRVVTVSHQNLLAHHELFVFGYQISNAEALQELLQRYGVLAHLSGHMHIQHFLPGAVPEVLTSPLSLVPCRYGLLTWDASGLRYEAKRVDVTAWAQSLGRTDGELLRFADYAAESFRQNAYRQVMDSYAQRELPDGAAERLARCFAEANLAFFTGEDTNREKLAEDLAFWVDTAGEGLETAYLRSILEDEAPDPLHILLWSGN